MGYRIDYRKAGMEPPVAKADVVTLDDINKTNKKLCDLQGCKFTAYTELPQRIVEDNERRIKEAKKMNKLWHGSQGAHLDHAKIEAARQVMEETNKLLGF